MRHCRYSFIGIDFIALNRWHTCQVNTNCAGFTSVFRTENSKPSHIRGMPKRRHPEHDGSSLKVVNDMVRFAVLRGVQQGSFRRDHLKNVIDIRHGPYTFDQLIDESNIILKEVYGLKINTVQSNNKKTYVVLETLPEEIQFSMGQLWQKHTKIHGKPYNDKLYFIPKSLKSKAPLYNQELVKTGVLTMVIFLVVLSENNLKQSVLRRQLANFGMPKLDTQKISSINTDTSSLLNDFVKRGYLVEVTHDKDIWYKLGWRAIQEYPFKVLLELMVRVANDESQSFIDAVSTTIIQSYACEFSRPIQEDNGNASSGSDHRPS